MVGYVRAKELEQMGFIDRNNVIEEMGEDPVEVCRYFGSRDRINHVHFRTVRVQKPYEKYAEVWLDEGDVNMIAVMKELVRVRYPRLVYPEHPRALDRIANAPTSSHIIPAAEDIPRSHIT
jgi:D-mannonate dehydratase